ncbi:MAG: hypothetical protein IPK83_14940 [Planctomycetes bacterium]|nr:hypothetical protein [Planctomycetota bacterium]
MRGTRGGGNDKVTIKENEGSTTYFKKPELVRRSEYATIEETFSPKALKAISVWLRQQLKIEKQEKPG